MRSFLKQPLVHFLLIGLGFFLLFKVFGDSDDMDSRTIVVNKDALMNYYQYQSQAFNEEVFEKRLASMSEKELEQLINSYIRDEVLYREAMAMGLEKEDNIIRRRLIQKVEFISEGVAEAGTKLTDKEIADYYEENKQKYYLSPYVTFTHVFFDFERWGVEEAEAKAKAEVAYLNNNNITFNQATSRGDRFFYHTNYVQRDLEYVKSHFGPSMASAIFEATPSDSRWIGPLNSEYGYHLVMLTDNVQGRYPDLDEIKERVAYDAERDYIRDQNEKVIQQIIDGYDVRVDYPMDGGRWTVDGGRLPVRMV